LLPYREDLLEHIGWIAQEIDEMGGNSWILPITELSEAEEATIRAQVNEELDAEYVELARDATVLAAATAREEVRNREIGALRRRLHRISARDHYDAAARREATRAVDDCLASIASRHSRRTVSIATD
jgi:hypothetical protein